MTPPTAEGGALRSQDLRTTGDPTGLDGTILRVDPDTGAALPDNPSSASADVNARRIVAHGLRNPFRITVRPGHERGVGGRRGLEHLGGDQPCAAPTVGRAELRLAVLRGRGPPGRLRRAQPEPLRDRSTRRGRQRWPPRTTPTTTAPRVVAGESVPHRRLLDLRASRSTTRPAFPARYRDALFFADYTRNCIWVMLPGANGLPDPARDRDLRVRRRRARWTSRWGPNGDLYYADLAAARSAASAT